MQDQGKFVRLEEVHTIPQMDNETFFKNVRANMFFDAPFIQQDKGWGIPKPCDIALIGGGPSLDGTFNELFDFPGVTVVCGSAHDHVLHHGLIPKYAIVCDPDPIVVHYMKNISKNTTYLIATSCDPGVFDHIKRHGGKIIKWHCFNNDEKGFKEIDPQFAAIGGGCTVGLRAITWSMMMGYKNIHLFGFDSCQGPNDEHHDYEYEAGEAGEETFYDVRFDSDKVYRCAGYQLGQAFNFRDFYMKYYDYFTVEVHGDGLIAEVRDKVDFDMRVEKLNRLRSMRKNSGSIKEAIPSKGSE